MKLYATSDIAASVRKAHEAYTHVVLNRYYMLVSPTYFRTSKIVDLPVYTWAGWDKASDGQLARWREHGGVLINRGANSSSSGPNDVVVFVEVPAKLKRLKYSISTTSAYSVLPRPVSWRQYDETLNLKTPTCDRLEEIWKTVHGQRITDDEMALLTGLPRREVMFQSRALKPAEEWDIRPRIAPEAGHFMPAWEWIGAGRVATRQEVGQSGFRVALKEMGRLGHIKLTKYRIYSAVAPDWETVAAKRRRATEDLHRVQSLVASLPDHLSGEPPFDVSPLFAARSRGKAR